jgi:exopolysaccharide production protein ExoZ
MALPYLMQPQNIIYSIQYLRAFAAGFVVLLHFTVEQTTEQLGVPLYLFFKQGFVGVDIFFVLSGYIISMTYASRSVTPPIFLLRRLARIFSGYWLVIVPYSAFLVVTSQYKDIYDPLRSALLIPELLEENPLPVIWTLYHEVVFYSIFSLLICFPKRFIPWIAITLLTAIMVQLSVAIWHSAYDTPEGFMGLWYKKGIYTRFIVTPYMAEFATGAYLYFYKPRIPYAPIFALAAFLWFAGINHYYFDNNLFQGMNECYRVATALPFATLMVYSATQYQLPCRGRIAAVSKTIGNASYSLYLIHMPLFSMSMMLCSRLFSFHIPAHFWAIIILSILATGVAIIWHISFEKPFYRVLLNGIARGATWLEGKKFIKKQLT